MIIDHRACIVATPEDAEQRRRSRSLGANRGISEDELCDLADRFGSEVIDIEGIKDALVSAADQISALSAPSMVGYTLRVMDSARVVHLFTIVGVSADSLTVEAFSHAKVS